jgi:hypothetical protein
MHTLDERPSIFIRDKPMLFSERLHKDNDRRGSVEKVFVVVIIKGLGAKTN